MSLPGYPRRQLDLPIIDGLNRFPERPEVIFLRIPEIRFRLTTLMTGYGCGVRFRNTGRPQFGYYRMTDSMERLTGSVDAERLAVLGKVLADLMPVLASVRHNHVKQFNADP